MIMIFMHFSEEFIKGPHQKQMNNKCSTNKKHKTSFFNFENSCKTGKAKGHCAKYLGLQYWSNKTKIIPKKPLCVQTDEDTVHAAVNGPVM